MKYITLLVVLAALYFLPAQGQTSCAIMDNYWRVFDVSNGYFNDTDKYGIVSTNMCLDMEVSCAHTSNEPCSVCQWLNQGTPSAHSYCLGYSKNEVYTLLPNISAYQLINGFRATLQGDVCGAVGPRTVNVDVLCNQQSDYLKFVDENVTCTYNMQLYLKSNCQPGAFSFTPTFTLLSVTPNSMAFSIDSGYPWMYFTYTVKLNDKIAYSGDVGSVVYINNLDPGTTYTVVVTRQSGPGAVLNIVAPSITKTVTTLPANIGNPYGGQVVGTPTAVVDGTGSGVAIGMLIAFLIVAGIFGLLKLKNSDWFADKFGGKSGGSRKGFSLMDAEKSAAFDS